jgi:hypothetical protein
MGMTRRMSKEELVEALKNIKEDSINNDESPAETYAMLEHMKETSAQYAVYDALSEEERKRWPEIQTLVSMRDNNKIAKHNLLKNQELDRLDTYFRSSGLDTSEIEKYLMDEIRECTKKISQYAFGRELLDNYSIEKFMLLFIDGDYYKPLNLYIKDFYEKKSANEIKEKLSKHYARLKALGLRLINLPDCPSDESDSTKEKKGKPGRKKIEVADDFSIKDIASPDQIKALNTLLIKHGYIEEIDGRFYPRKSKSVKKFAAIVKSLHEYGYSAKFKAAQAYYILTNDYNVTTTENTVNQAEDDNALSILKANPYLKK